MRDQQDHLERRVSQERAMARVALSLEAEHAHLELAEAYERRLADLGSSSKAVRVSSQQANIHSLHFWREG